MNTEKPVIQNHGASTSVPQMPGAPTSARDVRIRYALGSDPANPEEVMLIDYEQCLVLGRAPALLVDHPSHCLEQFIRSANLGALAEQLKEEIHRQRNELSKLSYAVFDLRNHLEGIRLISDLSLIHEAAQRVLNRTPDVRPDATGTNSVALADVEPPDVAGGIR